MNHSIGQALIKRHLCSGETIKSRHLSIMNKRRFFFLLWIGVFFLQAEAKPLHLDSIKVYIPFYGNYNDWSGWNNNGLRGNSGLGFDRNGNADRAFALVDSTNFLAVPTNHTQVPTFTYMQWVKLNGRPDSLGMTVFETGDAQCRHSLRLFSKGQDSVIMRYQIPFGDGDSIVQMAGRMTTNNWHHLAVIRSKDSVYLYMDVIFNTEFPVPGVICHQGNIIHYGANLDSGQMLHGALDEIRIYSENIEPSLMLSIVQGERLGMDEIPENTIQVYPIPSAGKIHIQFETGFDEILFYTAQAQFVVRRKFYATSEQELQINFAPGHYWVELRMEGKRIGIERIVIQ